MNQLIIVLIFLMMIINRLKFVVSFFLSMLLLSCEWSRHCRTMCLTFCLIQSQKHVDETTFNTFLLKNNQSILFDLYEFALLNCFRISSIFHAILIFWLWYRSSTSSRNYANVLFDTLFRFVFIWRWRFSYKLLIVACSLFCSFETIFSETFHIIVVCVRSTLWLRVDVVFRALWLIYCWFDCRNLRSTYNVRALSIDFWRRFANEINEDEWIEYAFLFSKTLTMWFERLLKRCAERFFAFS